MSTITVKDGTTIYYKDWGKGPVVTFSHGWPLSSDMWDGQMLFLAQHGFRCVAHDRRGHGRSGQAWSGNDTVAAREFRSGLGDVERTVETVRAADAADPQEVTRRCRRGRAGCP